MQQNPEDRQLSRRYQRQLGLRPSGLAEVLGHTAVGEVALVGSDPYLREGSDVTMIFKIRQQTLFDTELQKQLLGYKAEVPGLASSTAPFADAASTLPSANSDKPSSSTGRLPQRSDNQPKGCCNRAWVIIAGPKVLTSITSRHSWAPI